MKYAFFLQQKQYSIFRSRRQAFGVQWRPLVDDLSPVVFAIIDLHDPLSKGWKGMKMKDIQGSSLS